ncbi:MAG: 3-oxoacyl-(acyl-carrier-protein) synthase, partial [Kiritimatiellia bacterium]
GVPIVQGPMANVSEGPGLAAAVRAAGAQPFVALSALDTDAASQVLQSVQHIEGVGAGIIAFDVATTRDEHIRLTRSLLDGPIILAGGSPQLARRLQGEGAKVWLHTPAPRLAGMAVASGVRAVILEGHEAGGHIGALPSSVLWEQGLNAVRTAVQAGRAEAPLVILAGGIGDSVSAAFAALIAAQACAAGVRVALQVGTAFLFTREIVEAGQITERCQRMGLQAHETVLVGQTVNLPVRCLPNAGTKESRRQELLWAAEGLDTRTRRHRMEARNLGLSRLAAKGIERNPDWHPDSSDERYLSADLSRQLDHGVFSFGQGAEVTDTVQTVRQLVRDLTVGARQRMRLRLDPWGPAVPIAVGASTQTEPIAPLPPLVDARCAVAIVGLGCVLPDAVDVPSFWRNQLRNADSVAQLPADRWSVQRYHRPGAGSSGPAFSASCAAGAVRHLTFDGLRYRTPPTVQRTIDRTQIMALLAADEASLEAGFQHPHFANDRASVIFGNAMGGEWSKKLTMRVKFRDVLDLLVDEGHLDVEALPEIEGRLEARLDDELVPLQADSMVGLLGNLVAGRVASWLGWRGGNHTVDAACAASLMAVAQGVEALRAGRCDTVLCGGSDGDLSVETFVGFTRTLALSSAGSRPFSRAADGFVMGEGAAAFALVRLDDAVTQDLPIWGVIHGVGWSSDGRSSGLTAPAAGGQRLAIERAWADSDLQPDQASFIEAHGTGTDLGDRTEASVITEMFCASGGAPWVGTAKSSLGHLKSAAGAAGLLRATLIAATGVMPATLHAGDPIDGADALRLPRFPVRLDGRRIIGGVSAFGFGGTNVHLVISSPPDGARRPALLASLRRDAEDFIATSPSSWSSIDLRSSGLRPSPHVLLFAADDLDALVSKVERRSYARAEVPTDGWRLAVVATTDDPLTDVIDWLRAPPERGEWLGSRAVLDHGTPRPVVVLGPGQGAQRMGAVRSVSRYACARDLLNGLLDPLGGGASLTRGQTDTRSLHRHLVGVGAAWVEVLRRAEVNVHTALGHSLGELTALIAADCLSAHSAARLAKARGEALHGTPTGSMCAVHLPEASARPLAEGVHLAAINDPNTTIYAGTTKAIERMMDRTKREGARSTLLAVAHPFHSPQMVTAARALSRATNDTVWTPPSARWISAETALANNDPSSALV